MRKKFLYILLFINCQQLIAQRSSIFETITTNDGLPSNYIFCVEEDAEGFMWVGTDKGLCRFNGAVWEVWDMDKGIPGNYIIKIISDKHNGLWLGLAEKGLFHFDISTKKCAPIKQNNLITHFSINTNGDLLFTETDTLNNITVDWLCSYSKSNMLIKIRETSYEKNIISFLDSATKLKHYFNFQNSKSIPILQNGIVNHDLTKIMINFSNNNVAITPEFLLNNNLIFHYYSNAKNDTMLLQKANTIIPGQIIYCDTKEILYFALPNIGFYSINKKTNVMVHYTEKEGLNNLNINHIYKTKNGMLLISTLGGGINTLKPNPRNNYVPKQMPLRNLQVSNHKYYGLANGILYQFDSKSISKEFFLRKDALCFYLTNDTLLVGSFEGLHYYSFRKNKVLLQKTIPLTAGISSIVPFNNKWLYSTYGNGFFTTKNFITAERHRYALPFENIEKIIVLKNTIAALSYENGFFICDKNLNLLKHYTTQDGLPSNYVSTVLENNDTLWVGGKGGVSLIAKNKVFKTFLYQQGFRGKTVKYIFKYAKNNIQIVSEKYMHFITTDGNLKAYGADNVTVGKTDAVVEALYDENDFQIILSTAKTLSVNPMAIFRTNENVSEAFFSSIEIDGKAIDYTKPFEVNYNNTDIVFKFKPISNILFNQNHILYKLNDNDWKIVSDTLILNFKKLRPGKYTLYTKTINVDGFETKQKQMIKFTVNLPWWQQWWFLCLLAFVIFSCFWQLSKYWNKRKYLTKLNQQQQIETERQRISRDLHDNMGAYTSALIANVQQLRIKSGENVEIDKMQSNAEQIMEILRETIWVLNNKEISLQEFSDTFKNYCFKILKNFENINFKAIEDIKVNKIITANETIHLNKIMQEIFQNIIKHANATEIVYQLKEVPTIEISITDNGKGFDIQTVKRNNGLDNIEWRCKEIKFGVIIESTLLKGTSVQLKAMKNVKSTF